VTNHYDGDDYMSNTSEEEEGIERMEEEISLWMCHRLCCRTE